MDIDAESNDAFIQYLDSPCKEVQIGITQSVARESGFKGYVAYIIKVNSPIKLTVERRYREFAALREVFLQKWPGVFIPILPPKHTTGNSSLKVVNERMKYLSYFLNCVAKIKYLYESEQFQLFLNSNSSDLKKIFEKAPKATFQQIRIQYQRTFPHIKPDLTKKIETMQRVKDIIDPFYLELKESEMALVKAKKDLFRLAVKRQEYLKSLGDLYSDALPEFQKYMSNTFEKAVVILQNNEGCRNKIKQVKVSKAECYWIIYEAIRLQIGETRAAIDIIHQRQYIERDEERIQKKIVTNQEELMNIQNKKKSIKNFFNTNTEQLIRELQGQNESLKIQLQAIQLIIMYMYELIIKELISNFQEKRIRVWTSAYRYMIKGEKQLNVILAAFFNMIKGM